MSHDPVEPQTITQVRVSQRHIPYVNIWGKVVNDTQIRWLNGDVINWPPPSIINVVGHLYLIDVWEIDGDEWVAYYDHTTVGKLKKKGIVIRSRTDGEPATPIERLKEEDDNGS